MVYIIWLTVCIILTAFAWSIEVIPPEMQNLPMAPFFFLTSHKFVFMIAIPYLFVLGIVFTCDFIVLVIAICRKRDMSSPKTSLISANSRDNDNGRMYVTRKSFMGKKHFNFTVLPFKIATLYQRDSKVLARKFKLQNFSHAFQSFQIFAPKFGL